MSLPSTTECPDARSNDSQVDIKQYEAVKNENAKLRNIAMRFRDDNIELIKINKSNMELIETLKRNNSILKVIISELKSCNSLLKDELGAMENDTCNSISQKFMNKIRAMENQGDTISDVLQT